MFGYSTAKELPAKLTPIEKKYQIRWHMDKVLLELQMSWFLKTISIHQRGMYVSFDVSIDELAVKSERIKQLTKIQQFRDTKREVIKKAKGKIKNLVQKRLMFQILFPDKEFLFWIRG